MKLAPDLQLLHHRCSGLTVSPLVCCASLRSLKGVKYFLEKESQPQQVKPKAELALYFSVLNGDEALVDFLLDLDLDLNKEHGLDGATPLFIACKVNHKSIYSYY